MEPVAVAQYVAVVGVVVVEVFWRTRFLYVQDCTFTARLPCKWVIRDV
jgi:hypothetical protein